jgi:hypothetical protein
MVIIVLIDVESGAEAKHSTKHQHNVDTIVQVRVEIAICVIIDIGVIDRVGTVNTR